MITYSKRQMGDRRGGYILLLSVLISSIVLAISLGVYSIGLKQFTLSGFLSESQVALAAADRGVECFMYWDALFRDTTPAYPAPGPYTLFPQPVGSVPISTDLALPAGYGDIRCSGESLASSATWAGGPRIQGLNIVTTYNLNFADGSCTYVTVRRRQNFTQVISDGYNTCDVTNLRRTMRRIEVNAGI